MTIRIVPAKKAIEKWHTIEPFIQKIIDRIEAGHSTEQVLTEIQHNNMHLWAEIQGRGVILTQFLRYPRYITLFVYMTGGQNLKEWGSEAHDIIEKFGRDNGASFVEFWGRPGWEKMARQNGYDEKFIRMRKRLR